MRGELNSNHLVRLCPLPSPRSTRPPTEGAVLSQVAGFLVKVAATGSLARHSHGIEHWTAGVYVGAFPYRLPARTLSTDIQPRFDLLIAGPVNVQAGLGDASAPVPGMAQDVDRLSGNRRFDFALAGPGITSSVFELAALMAASGQTDLRRGWCGTSRCRWSEPGHS